MILQMLTATCLQDLDALQGDSALPTGAPRETIISAQPTVKVHSSSNAGAQPAKVTAALTCTSATEVIDLHLRVIQFFLFTIHQS